MSTLISDIIANIANIVNFANVVASQTFEVTFLFGLLMLSLTKIESELSFLTTFEVLFSISFIAAVRFVFSSHYFV